MVVVDIAANGSRKLRDHNGANTMRVGRLCERRARMGGGIVRDRQQTKTNRATELQLELVESWRGRIYPWPGRRSALCPSDPSSESLEC